MDISQFGKAYATMPQNDPHAPGSVDRVLADRMVRFCVDTAEYLYTRYSLTSTDYEMGSRPVLEGYVSEAAAPRGSPTDRVSSVVDFCHELSESAVDDLDEMRFGGTEEQIVARGSDWCPDVARVACTMCQIADVPARLVSLFNLRQAYSGHQIIEVFVDGVWGAADPLNRIMYRHAEGGPATTWDLMNDDQLVRGNWQSQSSFYADPRQFGAAAVINYTIGRMPCFDYTVSSLGSYNLSILDMANAGWPGGLRWLQGEQTSLR